MIKRTIEISQDSAHLAVRLDQLLIQPHEDTASNLASIPCEDIGIILSDHPRNTYSHGALTRLAECGAALVICGRNHLPAAVLMPMADHSEARWRVNDQIAALQRKPLCKRLWKQIVQSKIAEQARNLPPTSPVHRRLRAMIREVRSGDPTNVEAQAARIYWQAWTPDPAFRRNPNGDAPLNVMLNYGYAVMRACVARALVAAGLLPILGLHHSNRSNAFALADDLVEPLRPVVDARVHHLYQSGLRTLNRTTKAGLLDLLTCPMMVKDEQGPLMVSVHRMAASLVKCFKGEENKLVIPRRSSEEGQSPCT